MSPFWPARTCLLYTSCKEAIEASISEHYRDNRLDRDAVPQVIEQFGYTCTLYVLANTVQQKEWEDVYKRQVKQLERTKKALEARLEKLQAEGRKDDVVTFEQLGVDRLFVDEAHNYKNLFLYTKMRNVAGLSTTDAQKSSRCV